MDGKSSPTPLQIDQDDIDRLLSGIGEEGARPPVASDADGIADILAEDDRERGVANGPSPVAEADPFGALSLDQSEIDRLLSGETPPLPEPPSSEASVFDTLEQDDIDAMLSGGRDAFSPESAVPSELDAVFGPAADLPEDAFEPAPSPDLETGPFASIDQSEIDRLLSGTPVPTAPETPIAPSVEPGFSTIDQDEIDRLLSGEPRPEPAEASSFAPLSSGDPDGIAPLLPEEEGAGSSSTPSPSASGLTGMDAAGIDALLSPGPDVSATPTSGLVGSEAIEALLSEIPTDPPPPVSEAEIDRLLGGATEPVAPPEPDGASMPDPNGAGASEPTMGLLSLEGEAAASESAIRPLSLGPESEPEITQTEIEALIRSAAEGKTEPPDDGLLTQADIEALIGDSDLDISFSEDLPTDGVMAFSGQTPVVESPAEPDGFTAPESAPEPERTDTPLAAPIPESARPEEPGTPPEPKPEMPPEPESIADPAPDFGAGSLDQDAIDALLSGDGPAPAPEVATESVPDAVDEAEGEEGPLSQAALDSLLEEMDDAPVEAVAPMDTAEMAAVSQDDIDAMLSGNEAEDADGPGTIGVTQDEINRLLSGEPDPPLPTAPETALEDLPFAEPGFRIDMPHETEPGSNRVSQDYLDALIAAHAEAQAVPDAKEAPFDPADEAEEEEPFDGDALISQDDITALLSGALPDLDVSPMDSAEDADLDLISGDDIDRLLDMPEAEASTGEVDDSFISPADIDSLLSGDLAAPAEADAIPSDLLDGVALPEEDGEEAPSAVEPSAKSVPIQLEEEVPASGPKKRSWVRWAVAASVLVCVGVTSAGVWWKLFRQETPVVATGSVPALSDAEIFGPSVSMPGFVVPGSPGTDGVRYIVADLEIDLDDSAAASMLKRKPAIGRNVVFQVLRQAMDRSAEQKITEADLEELLADALNRLLPEPAVTRVFFTKFRIG